PSPPKIRTTQLGGPYFLSTKVFELSKRRLTGKGEQEKTIEYRFFAAKEPKQGAPEASVSSDTGRLCDASGRFTASNLSFSAKNRSPDHFKASVLLYFHLKI
ncbi:MAG: hypothetical protein J6L85_03815, partial [Clostridia bacterium]|nr:hypothetical protein [Clostridia bacterium]